jgi:hypothetical protein
MNAIYLHLPDGTDTKWSMCSECNTVAAPGNFDLSQKCCTCYDCGLPLPKDERIPYSDRNGKSLYHRDCERKRRMEREADMMEKAELVTDYDGPVYLDHVGNGSYGDGFFSDVEELSEHLDFQEFFKGEHRPLFAHCCEERGFSIDLDQILQNATEEMHEDAYDNLSGVEELQEAVNAFNKANAGLKSWDPDFRRKVAIPLPPEEDS